MTERRVEILKNSRTLSASASGGGGVVRMVVGTRDEGGRLKNKGESRCGEVKRVTWSFT